MTIMTTANYEMTSLSLSHAEKFIEDQGSIDLSKFASIDDDASSSEEEEERPTKRRGAQRTQQQQPRTSSRSTRFQKSMKEPKDGIRDLLARLDEVPKTPQTKKGNSSSPRHSKSPAVRHSSRPS